MLENILRKILPWRIVHKDDYMIRYFLWGSKGEGLGDGRSIRLHHIKSSDHARALHDHPYNWTSFVLKSGYIEHTPEGQKNYRAGMVNKHKATDLHRLEINRPAWTLFFCGPRIREWGFQDPENGWMVWREYSQKYCK